MTSISSPDPFSRMLKLAVRVLGAVFFIVGVGLIVREYSFGKEALPSTGSIVELRVSDSGDGPNYYPIVEFSTASGEKIQFEGVPTSPPPVKGTTVPVLYRASVPKDARINTFVDRWLFPSLFTPIGLVMIMLAGFKWSRKGTDSLAHES